MKRLFSLILCILLLAGCANTYDGPTAAKTVLSETETSYFFLGELSQQTVTEYAYDIYGNRSVVQEYQEGKPSLKTVMTCDESGNVIRQVQCQLNGWLPKKIVDARYTYDDQGRLTSTRHRAGGLSWDDDTTVYDDEAMTRTYTGHNGTAIDHLNELGWVMRTEQTFSDGQIVLTEYDRRSDGQIETMRTYTEGALTSETVMTYDDQGRILTQSELKDGVSTLLFSWEYGEDYEKMTHSDGSYTITDYNPDGTPDDRIVCNADGSLRERTIYRYTEIQVPAEEVSP